MRARFWIEVSAAVVCGLLAVLTLVVMTDRGRVRSGSGTRTAAQRSGWIVVPLGAGVIVSALLAGYEWRRTSTLASEA